jgi:hypothetical protein
MGKGALNNTAISCGISDTAENHFRGAAFTESLAPSKFWDNLLNMYVEPPHIQCLPFCSLCIQNFYLSCISLGHLGPLPLYLFFLNIPFKEPNGNIT